MKALLSWIKEYVDINLSPEELADRLTNSGLEVDDIIYTGQGLDSILVGEVKEISTHPESDSLFVCKVDVGGNHEHKTFISAATNLFKGAKV